MVMVVPWETCECHDHVSNLQATMHNSDLLMTLRRRYHGHMNYCHQLTGCYSDLLPEAI